MEKRKQPKGGRGCASRQLIVRHAMAVFVYMFTFYGLRRRSTCYGAFFALFITLVSMTTSVYGGNVVDRVLAIVNDEIISLYELNQRIIPYAKKIKEAATSAGERDVLLQKVTEENLSLLIDEKLADQEIRRLNIKVGESEVNREVERFKSVNRLTDSDLQEALAAEGSDLDEFGRQIKEQILRARLVNREIRSKIVITNEEVTAYYQAHPDEFGGKKKYFLRNIVVARNIPETSSEKAAAANRLERVQAEFTAGKAFDVLARQYSDAANAVDGGLLGFIGERALAPQIQTALEPLEAGGVTDIIETDQGYQMFFIEKIEVDAAQPFEKVKTQIEDKLYKQVVNRQYEKWLQDLRSRAHIKLIQ